MSIVSHLHHLFNPDTCQSYLHTLRWKDRALQCPRCQSHHVGPWGALPLPARPETLSLVRERLQSAPSMTSAETLWTAASARHALDARRTFLLCLSCSSQRIAREVEVMSGPATAGAGGYAMPPCPMSWSGSWRAPWKRMNSITPLARRGKRHRAGKNLWAAARWAPQETRKPGRGHYDQRPAQRLSRKSAARGRSSSRRPKDFTVQTVRKAADLARPTGSRLYTDSASSYRALKGCVHAFVNHTKKEYARGEVHENRAECLFSPLQAVPAGISGPQQNQPARYVGFFQFLAQLSSS